MSILHIVKRSYTPWYTPKANEYLLLCLVSDKPYSSIGSPKSAELCQKSIGVTDSIKKSRQNGYMLTTQVLHTMLPVRHRVSRFRRQWEKSAKKDHLEYPWR